MFSLLGKVVARTWPVVLIGWAAVVVGLWVCAPSWEKVGKSGQFAYLPADAPTRQAEELFDEAFPGQAPEEVLELLWAWHDSRGGPLLAARVVAETEDDWPAWIRPLVGTFEYPPNYLEDLRNEWER